MQNHAYFPKSCCVPRSLYNYPDVLRDIRIKSTYFKREVCDPYQWLEKDSPEIETFIKDQSRVTNSYLESVSHRDTIKGRLTDFFNFERFGLPTRCGSKYLQTRNTGLQDQVVTYILDNFEAEPRVLIDPNQLSDDGTVNVSEAIASNNGKTVAYVMSKSGSDWREIKFLNVETGEPLDDCLERNKFVSPVWLPSNDAVIYGAYSEQGKTEDKGVLKHQKLYYHLLGTPQSEDIMIVEFDDPEVISFAIITECGSYLIILGMKRMNYMVHFAKLGGKITKKLDLVTVVPEPNDKFQFVTNDKNNVYFLTTCKAPNLRIVVINFDKVQEENWKNFIPEHEKNVIMQAVPFNTNYLFVEYLEEVKSVLFLYDLKTGKPVHKFDLGVGAIVGYSSKKSHTEAFYMFSSLTIYNEIHKVSFNGKLVNDDVIFESKSPNFDSNNYETSQVFYNSKDGTEVPMFIVHKKDLELDGTHPTLLYGYGGFMICVPPKFNMFLLAFVDNFNGVAAVANIRGGGEYGDKWHDNGRLANKQNCFDDFQYAAKYLIDNQFTQPSLLTLYGTSNGGLLVAACVNQTPELFGAALCFVGVFDMLRFHKFTIGHAWIAEFGCADSTYEQFKYLYKYSPLHNVRVPPNGGQYPAVLLFTADHDDRVVPLHSFKFISELQYRMGRHANQKNPLMIRIETKAGHGQGKPVSKWINEYLDGLCFLSKALGIKFSNLGIEDNVENVGNVENVENIDNEENVTTQENEGNEENEAKETNEDENVA